MFFELMFCVKYDWMDLYGENHKRRLAIGNIGQMTFKKVLMSFWKMRNTFEYQLVACFSVGEMTLNG
jgi:hypothetical protein